MDESIILNADYWDSRYKQNQIGWDIGAPSRPIQEFVEQLADKSMKILIPGAGNAYEAEYLSEKGFQNITVVDFAPTLCTALKEKFRGKEEIKIVEADFFKIEETFDLIIEQTFFCALDPNLRSDYVAKMAKLLAPKGKLTGLLFNCTFENSPPFGGNIAEYQSLFEKHFKHVQFTPCLNSIEPRLGKEVWFEAKNELG